MKVQQFLRYALLIVALFSGCATGAPSTTSEMSPGSSGERIGGQAGLVVTAINQKDHSKLVSYYSLQAQELREKAKHWDMIAEAYEKQHQDPSGKMSSAENAAPCRAIAQNYRAAAEGAEVLATIHRAKVPQSVVQ